MHINTEVRIAWRHGLESALSTQRNEIVPYEILPRVVDSIKPLVETRLRLFNSEWRVALPTS